MMFGEITQDNLYLLLPAKVSLLADRLSEERGIRLTDAIRLIYSSDLYKRLAIEDTKIWHWSPVDLYQELQRTLPPQAL